MYFPQLCFCLMMSFAQQACAQDVDKPVLLMNATVHQGNGEVIENAALAYQGKKITLLADARVIRLDMRAFEVVEAYGLQIYPASLVNKPPVSVSAEDTLFYMDLGNSPKGLLIPHKFSADLPLPVLEEGAEATFVVTEQPLMTSTAEIRYLVIKGKMKQENNLSLHLLNADQ